MKTKVTPIKGAVKPYAVVHLKEWEAMSAKTRKAFYTMIVKALAFAELERRKACKN